MADQIAILRRGQVVARDAPAALRARATSGTRVRIELARPHPAALDSLRAVEGIHELAAESASASVLTYSTADPTSTNPEVIARLSAAGAPIVSVTCETRTLEDVYAAAMGVPGTTTSAGEGALPAASR